MNLKIFLISITLLNIMPGPAIFFVAQQSIFQNLRGSLLAVLGVQLGVLAHILFGLSGLSLLIANSPRILLFLQCIAAVYLIFLGASQLISLSSSSTKLLEKKYLTGFEIVFHGFLINLLNPKVMIFFTAILPQFIAHQDNCNFKILLFGMSFILVGLFIDSLIILFTKKIKPLLQTNAKPNVLALGISNFLFIIYGIGFVYLSSKQYFTGQFIL